MSAAGGESPILHGGRLDVARLMFPDAPQPWVDLSTGVSPFPYPFPELPAKAFTRLPDAEALAALERVAARAYGAGERAAVVAGAGSQAFIQLLPRLLPSSRQVRILGRTYEEHAAAWRAAGASVARASALDELECADVAIVVNPNNPDGRLETRDRLASVAASMASRGGLLVVDEAFMDMLGPAHSLAPLAGEAGVVILRSFGKAYGLPGLRLGFALCEARLGERIRHVLGPWSVSGPAIAVGATALADEAWLAARAEEARRSGERLDALLRPAGFEPVGGSPLFRLVRHDRAARWFAIFGGCGILTRAFRERPDWLRFGLPGDSAAWERLARALESGHGV